MDDLEFVRQCVKGDRQTWDEFVTRYSRLIYGCIHHILALKGSSRSLQDDVRDIFQEIFVSLSKDNFHKLRTFKGKNGCSLASWLRQVAVNATIDYLRRLKAPAVSLDEDREGFSLHEALADGSPLPGEGLAGSERVKALKDCIGRLEVDDKYFLELYLNRGLGLEQLKGALKISRGAVDMRRSRIVERLRECFEGKGFQVGSLTRESLHI